MHIFGDPSHIPVVIVERVMNAPRRTISDNSYMKHVQLMDSPCVETWFTSLTIDKHSVSQSSSCTLKTVVFVHGFQASFAHVEIIANSMSCFVYRG